MMKRKLLFLALLGTAMALHAQEKVWCMVTDAGDKIAASRIGFVLASDWSETFSIVCNDGAVVFPVAKATFEQATPSGITTPRADGPQVMIASSSLHVMGFQGHAAALIYDLAGRQVLQADVAAGNGVIDISALPAGIYVVKVGQARVKFQKK